MRSVAIASLERRGAESHEAVVLVGVPAVRALEMPCALLLIICVGESSGGNNAQMGCACAQGQAARHTARSEAR